MRNPNAILLMLLCCCPPLLRAQDANSDGDPAASPDAEIRELVTRLGDADFARREAAELALEKLGPDTFEALEEAQNSKDLEIAMRAANLLQRFRVTILDSDPPVVRNLLRSYTQHKTADDRLAVLQQLLALPDRAGWASICRLVRLEQDETLSKQAALVLITQHAPPADEVPAVLSALAAPKVTGKRRGQEWLRNFRLLLQDTPRGLAAWDKAVEEEFTLLAEENGRTSEEIVTRLARWHVSTLCELKLSDRVRPWIDRLLALREKPSLEEFEEHVDWICHLELWSEVERLAESQAELFDEEALLKYRLAEARLKLGNKDAALKLADEAFAVREKSLSDHEVAATSLAARGMFEWAEREYRHVISIAGRGTEYESRSRDALSEMLHDLGREEDAAKVIKELLDYVATDEKARMLLERGFRTIESRASRMNYFFGLAELSKKNQEKAESLFRESFEADRGNVDSLIALYRLPNPAEESRNLTLTQLRNSIREYQENIGQLQQELVEEENPQLELQYRYELARNHNDYAWLVSNTEGDFDGAIRSSLESLKLRPNQGAYLDTLGRCYYARGDLANAIRYQTAALRQDPHSGLMQRQLAIFKAAFEKQKQQDK